MRRAFSKIAITSLLLSTFAFIPTPAATAAACTINYGTISGYSRYAKITGGSSCTWDVPYGVTSLSYLVVGGGGGGGGARTTTAPNLGGGGGGAGGLVVTGTLTVAVGNSFSITVGTGGGGGAVGSDGSTGQSTFFSYLGTPVSAGGGGGGGGANGSNNQTSLAGDGGANGTYSGGSNDWDGAGGGAGSAANGSGGTDIPNQGGTGGNGGAATSNALTGSTLYYGGGGGGGGTPSTNSSETDGTGGNGGNSVGGNGGGLAGVLPTAGATNTGSGGGGGGWRSTNSDAQRAGAAGSDGVIIFVYTKADATITNTTSPNADGEYFNGDTIDIVVTFTETVTVTGAPTLPLETGSTDGSATYLSGSGGKFLTFRYTVVANRSTPDLTTPISASISLNGGTIKSLDGFASYPYLSNGLDSTVGALAYNKNINFNATKVVNVTSPNSNGNYVTGETLTITVEFTGNVTKGCGTNLPMRSQSSSKDAVYTSGSGTKFLTYIYTVLAADNATDLDYLNTGSLRPAGCQTISDAFGSDIIYTLATPGATGSLSYNKNFSLNAPSSTVNLTKSGGGTTAVYRTVITLLATASVAGKAKFYANGKVIAGCASVSTVSLIASCSWKPATRGYVTLYARLTPTSTGTLSSSSSLVSFFISNRTALR